MIHRNLYKMIINLAKLATLNKIEQIPNGCQLLRNCNWYNSHISENMIFFPDWYKKGIYLVDIINTD